MLKRCRESLAATPRFAFACMALILLMILVLNAGPSMMDDTDSYHIQMIKWVREFGTVPGIANLHLRFGFNSSWFVSIALLSFPLPGLNSFTGLNGLVAFWFCFFLIEKISLVTKAGIPERNPSAIGLFIVLLLALLNWPLVRGAATSANYDFITTCCVTILFTDLFDSQKPPSLEWLIWPLYLFTVRMINAPILLLSLFFIIYHFKETGVKAIISGVGLATIVIVPFLIRNLMLSGYIFFPIYQIDWFTVDWKADKLRVIEIAEYIKYFNRVNAGFRPLAEISKLHFPAWVPQWYHFLYRPDKILVTVSVIGYGIILIGFRSAFDFRQRCFIAVALLQLVFWFFSAPDPRFVQGWLLFGLFAAMQMVRIPKINWHKTARVLMLSLSLITAVYGISKIFFSPDFRNLVTPAKLPVPVAQMVMLGHIALYLPDRVLNNWNPRCYDLALPCLYKVDPRLRARGPSVKDGFRLENGNQQMTVGGEYKIKD